MPFDQVISLGYIRVTTPGTPVRATVNRDNATRAGASSLAFHVLPENAGLVYIGEAGMNKTTGVGVLAILGGDVTSFSVDAGTYQQLDAASYFVDADEANDGVLGSFER